MKKILAFAGSNSKTSINKQLAKYASSLLKDVEVNLIDLNDFDAPLYSIDLEGELEEMPESANRLLNLIKESDGLVLSLAEHNGVYATVFKNLFDWMTRIESNFLFKKPMLLMATSPGARGGQTVLTIAKARFPWHDGNIVATFSLPSFNENFENGKITNEDLNNELLAQVEELQKSL
ncbi:NADPH-dependent FMN reductase [Winogradskyella sp. HB-48]|uniref:NADPH-dependent FMN reductase n=1 Tax=Winogradskyella sp. HB-48 TaxID=3416808 RepID=UPI003CF7BDD9